MAVVVDVDDRVVLARSGAPGVLCIPDDCSLSRPMSNPLSPSSSSSLPLLSPSLISSSNAPRDPVLASTLDRVRAAGESNTFELLLLLAAVCRAAEVRDVEARLEAGG